MSLDDQIFMSTKVLEMILAIDAIGVCVTFIDAPSTLSEQTVSMVSTVVPTIRLVGLSKSCVSLPMVSRSRFRLPKSEASHTSGYG